MDLFQVVEMATIGVTFLMMLSGIPPCISMYNTGETKSVPLPFFLVCMMNAAIGLCYGVLTNNNVLSLLNSVGLTLFSVYVLVYIMVSKDKGSPMTKVTAMLAIFLSQVGYLVYIVRDQSTIISTLGSMMFVWSFLVVVTPVLEIVEVLQLQDSDGVPLSLLFGGCLCSLAWSFYGYLLKDINIYGPNIIGNIINLVRLIVLVMYRGGSKKKTE